jgi:fatty-acyl-CoA synthase
MKLSLVTSAYPDNTIDEVIRKAAHFRYEGVELRPTRRILLSEMLKPENLKSINALLTEHNVEVSCVSPLVTLAHEKADERINSIGALKSYIDLAVQLNCKRVRTFGGSISGSREVAKKNVVDCLKKCADYAKEREISIDIETHDDFNTGRIIQEILDEVASRNVRALYDVAWPYCAGEPCEETIRLLGNYIDFVHVKDLVKRGTGVKYVLIGKGELDFRRIIGELKDTGYEGYLAVEWEKDEDPEIEESDYAVQVYAEALRKLIQP